MSKVINRFINLTSFVESAKTPVAADLLAGKEAWANGVKIVGEGVAGGGATPTIKFRDYDNNVIAEYTIAQMQALTELPTPPARDDLTFQTWNYSLEDIKLFTDEMYVDAIYITSSGKTEIFRDFTNQTDFTSIIKLRSTSSSAQFTFTAADGTVYTASGSVVTFTHTYASAIVGIETIECTHIYYFYASSNLNCFTTVSSQPNLTVTEVRLGSNYYSQLYSYSFQRCHAIKRLSLTTNITQLKTSSCAYCHCLEKIVIPPTVVSFDDDAIFNNCNMLKDFALPNSVTTVYNNLLHGCANIETISVPYIGTSTYNYNNHAGCIFSNNFSYTGSIEQKWYSSETAISVAYMPKKLKRYNITKYQTLGMSALMQCGWYKFVFHDGVDYSRSPWIFRDGYYPHEVTNGSTTYLSSYGSYYAYDFGLTKATITSPVTSLTKDYTFLGCINLTELDIGESVTAIRYNTYQNCLSLSKLILRRASTTTEELTVSATNTVTLSSSIIGFLINTDRGVKVITKNGNTLSQESYYTSLANEITFTSEATEGDVVTVEYLTGITTINSSQMPYLINPAILKIYVPDFALDVYKNYTNWITQAAFFRPLSELEE